MIPLLSTVMWAISNVKYLLIIILTSTTLIVSLCILWLLRRCVALPSLGTILSYPFRFRDKVRKRGARSSSSGVGTKGGPATRAKARGDVKPDTRSSVTTRGGGTRRSRKQDDSFVSVGVRTMMEVIRSALSTALVLSLLSATLICAFSLTNSGCQTLRQLGLIEWLPWKKGLKCYKTKWDWVAEVLGGVILSLLRTDSGSLGSTLGLNIGAGGSTGAGALSGISAGIGAIGAGLKGL